MYRGKTDSCSNRIKTALLIRGMKQADLCQITQIPKSAISQYISGAFEPKQDRIYLISKALNVSEAWLIGYDVPMERQEPQKLPTENSQLTEGEQLWLALYHSISDDTRKVLINMMKSYDRLPAERKEFALQVIRAALGVH